MKATTAPSTTPKNSQNMFPLPFSACTRLKGVRSDATNRQSTSIGSSTAIY
jgi:hypothetical protein